MTIRNYSGDSDDSLTAVLTTLLVEIGFIVPVVAMSKTILTLYILGLPYDATPVIVASLLPVAIYLCDRLAITDEDTVSTVKTRKVRLTRRYRLELWTVAVGALLAFMILTMVELSVWEFLLINIPLFVFVCYGRLKHTLLFDTLGIAVAWASYLLCTAVFFTNDSPDQSALLPLFIALGIMKISETELGNLRDIQGDAAAGNETIPMKIGIGNTKLLLAAGETAAMVILVFLSRSAVFAVFVAVYLLALFELLSTVTPKTATRTILKTRLVKIGLALAVLSVFH